MDLQDMLKRLSTLNSDVGSLLEAGEKLGETLLDLVNEIEKLVTTKAEVNSITIHEED